MNRKAAIIVVVTALACFTAGLLIGSVFFPKKATTQSLESAAAVFPLRPSAAHSKLPKDLLGASSAASTGAARVPARLPSLRENNNRPRWPISKPCFALTACDGISEVCTSTRCWMESEPTSSLKPSPLASKQ